MQFEHNSNPNAITLISIVYPIDTGLGRLNNIHQPEARVCRYTLTTRRRIAMQVHDIHECDTHEHHGDEPGHVHDPHECDGHEHHVHDHAGHVH